MKRPRILKVVEPVWVTWQEPGEAWIKVGELVSSGLDLISSDEGRNMATVLRFGEYVQVEAELLRPRLVAA